MFNGTERPEIHQVLESRVRLKALFESLGFGRFMSADEQIHWQNASRSAMVGGSVAISQPDGSFKEYVYCTFDDKDYHKNEDGIFVYDSDHRLRQCDDPEVRRSFEKLETEDRKINQSRDWIAKQYAEGDSILEEILRMHLDFTCGKIEPFSYEGILFFQLGRNSSHEFFVGIRNGKTYRMSTGEEYDPETPDSDADAELPESRYAHHVVELESDQDWGYVGHF